MANSRSGRDMERIVRFHGHFCGGIVIGYRAAKVALHHLGSRRAEDEELVAIVENDSCAVDAVQVITGCTLRQSGRAVRVSRKPGPRLSPDEMLAAPADELFWVEDIELKLPPPARIHNSVPCQRCGEAVMSTRTRRRGGRLLCIPCAQRGQPEALKPPLRTQRPG